MPARLTRRPVTPADRPFLLALRQRTMDPHLLASGADASEARHRARLEFRYDCGQVLLHQGTPAGMLKVVREGPQWKIVQIQVIPELQGRGFGGEVLEEVIAEAQAAGAGVCLSVLKAIPAKALYERLGFVVTGTEGLEYLMRREA